MTGIFSSRFARSVTVTDGGGNHVVRAFLQPVSLSKPEAPKITPGGLADTGRWLILMEPMTLTGTVTVTADGTVFRMLRRENCGSHMEGILVRRGAAESA